jgi:hypothetical protein
MVEQAEAVTARHQHGKHISAATDSDATIEDTVFSMWSVTRHKPHGAWRQDKLICGKPPLIKELWLCRQSLALLAAAT